MIVKCYLYISDQFNNEEVEIKSTVIIVENPKSDPVSEVSISRTYILSTVSSTDICYR